MKDVQFMTATQKRNTLKAWERFLKNGLKEKDFTEALYKHLSLHCSFIAHYNRGGFYSTYFTSPIDIQTFLTQFDKRTECFSVEYGSLSWRYDRDYEDINEEMIEIASKYIPQLTKEAVKIEYDRAVDEVKTLIKKYKIPLEDLKEPEVCCVCGKPGDGNEKEVCTCECKKCKKLVFNDNTIRLTGLCQECDLAQEEKTISKITDNLRHPKSANWNDLQAQEHPRAMDDE